MNISSLIVMVSEGDAERVVNEIKSISGCDVPISENNILIVSIEGENIESETEKMKKIESIDGVISAKLVYAYAEDELEAEKQKIEMSEDFPEWLNEENMNARDIPYSGRLKI